MEMRSNGYDYDYVLYNGTVYVYTGRRNNKIITHIDVKYYSENGRNLDDQDAEIT